jgi:hypothetical protein
LFPTKDQKESWISFIAKADAIIMNMLESTETDKLEGTLEIANTKLINPTLVEFIVYLHPRGVKLKEDPFVRKLMEEYIRK